MNESMKKRQREGEVKEKRVENEETFKSRI
jgi:hypothetical protein